MSEHKHEGIIGTDGLLRCRTCGQLLEQAEEEVTRVGSKVKAKRVLDEIAVAGNYFASSFEGGFVVYTRKKDGVTEEITGEQLTDRDFVIKKRFTTKEVI